MIPFIGSSCVLCNTQVQRTISLCNACQADFPVIYHACTICGIPLSDAASQVCGKCLKSPPTVDYSINLYHYETPVDHLISQLKFSQQLSYAAILGFLLSERLLAGNLKEHPDVIIPVPLHKKRLTQRGFNQSLEIAREVVKKINVPIDYTFVKREKATLAQSELDAVQRKRNIKGCFALEKETNYQHVVLIDDVVTTGATTNELAILLKNNGIKKVGVWSIARAILYN